MNTEALKFMGEHPWLTFFLVAVLCSLLGNVIWGIIVILPNRIMRHWNIRKHGYPPVHCDADGDFKKQKKSE